MKKQILLTLLCFALTGTVFSQVTLTLSGYPLVTTGWTIGGNASVVDSEIQLTPNTTSQNGHVYYNTSENVTACGQFTVDFDYKIAFSSGCLGDGIAFYFINPMTSYSGGGGLGMPAPLTGFVFTMDTYDNDLDGNNPEDELMGYSSPTTYTEGAATYHLAPLLAHQSYMADGAWHHIHISYNGGTIRVYVNGATTPTMTGYFPITTAGYFGFSAGTGACISAHYIKSVLIQSNTISAILGTTTVCQGSTTTLSDSTTGGTWTSGSPGVATVGSSSGVVNGIATGTGVITYTYNTGACSTTATVNVVTPPAAIGGIGTICIGTSTTFTDATPGGTWTSSNSLVASVGSSSGLVSGVGGGTATITYSTGGTCYVTAPVTVSATAVISGPSSVCMGSTITLTTTLPSGNTWSSGAPGIAAIGSTTGIVTPVSPGVVTITDGYSICSATKTITVNASPAAITGTMHVCVGYTTSLFDVTATGVWTCSSVPPGVAAISSTGVVTGDAGGTSLVSYTLPGGCAATTIVTVNNNPLAIIGASSMCSGTTMTLIDLTGGGRWVSSTGVATIGSVTGTVSGISGGATVITYTLATGCYTIFPMTINPSPGAIGGSLTVCLGATATLTDTSAGGYWWSATPIVADIDPASGVDTGLFTDTATMIYTLGVCSASVVITVNSAPAISASDSVECVGSSIISLTGGGGIWTSVDPTVASVGSLTGIVTGVGGGITTILFTSGTTTCGASQQVTINPVPLAISGPSTVCVGLTIPETDLTPGGVWGRSNTHASVSVSGIVTGGSAGVDTIYYTGVGGCAAMKTVTVNSTPAPITTALNHICPGTSTTMLDVTVGGTFTAAPVSVATITPTGGLTGIAPGIVTVTYSLGAGCSTTATVTVNALPPAIGGPTRVCSGSCITATDGSGPGTWGSVSAMISVGSSSGSVCGLSPGVATVTYTVTSTGCKASELVTVNPLPTPYTVTGGGSYCSGGTGVPVGLSGSSSGVNYQLYDAGTLEGSLAGTGGALSFGLETASGTYTVVATNPVTTCSVTMTGSAIVSINPLPPLCAVSGGGALCSGGSGVPVSLLCSTIGINYQLLNGVVIVGAPVAGTGSPLSFGLQTGAGTYTVVATNPATGCSRTMTGSATVTVNPSPAPIGGPMALCPGATITCTDVTLGGTWAATPTATGSISTSGVLRGIVTGTVTVTYTLGTGCLATEVVTVSPAPTAIIGPPVVCVGQTITLSDGSLGGDWTSSAPGVATIGSLSGNITGVIVGTTTVTYSLGTGCTVTKLMSVDPASPPITGPVSVCTGSTISLIYGGTSPSWGSSNPAIATVSTSGVVTGLSPGTVIISCPTLGTGCPTNHTVSVNPTPPAIGGPSVVCAGSTITETNTLPSGVWSTSSANIAIGSSSGIVTGILGGAATITYSVGACTSTKTITVNGLAAVSAAASGMCVGTTLSLGAIPIGGVWGTTSIAVCTVNPTGVATGIIAGVDTITYTVVATGCTTNYPITVNPLPLPITGSGSICVAASLTLSDGVGGGSWTSLSPATATVISGSGVVTGAAPGVATIVYTVGGCNTNTTVTVIASPSAISGSGSVCARSTVTEVDGLPGGVWFSADATLATVGSSTGAVTGVSAGTVLISYVLGTGCAAIKPVIVNPVSDITGIPIVCVRTETTLADTTLGGIWMSSSPSIATVDIHGNVTGAAAGTVNIEYTLPTGCVASQAVTVNPAPLVITGPSTMCAGATVGLTYPGPGAIWSSGSPATATVSSLTGLVTGVSPGAATFYCPVGSVCPSAFTMTVEATPLAITGPNVVCIGNTVALSDGSTGGVWNSSAPSIAPVSSTGVVTGSAGGTATISYSFTSGCFASMDVSVNPSVSSISGDLNVCIGNSTTLTDPDAGGAWSCSATPVGSIDPVMGAFAGLSAGTSTVTYSTGAGCNATATVTVHALPSGIGGSPQVCQGATTTLTDLSPAGSWASSDPSTASIVTSTGVVSGVAAGSVTITYTLASTGCIATFGELVNPQPAAIDGFPQVCVGLTTSLSDVTPLGVWTSSNPPAATVDGSGTVLGIAGGTTTVSYTLGTGCASSVIVTVNPFPTAIIGSSAVCQGSFTTYTDGVPGGVWTSSDPTIAAAGSSSGIITGIAPGSVTVTYAAGAGCTQVQNITVNPLPAAISGPMTVCATQNILLTDGTPSGAWSSVVPSIATITSGTGVLTGVSAGPVTISYTNGFGCASTYGVTVNPMPSAIAGNTNVCLGGTSALTDVVTGGTWVSSDPGIASIGSVSGVVTGNALGATSVVYTLPAGCAVVANVHVYPLPSVFTVSGTGSYCAGGAGVPILLSGSAVGVNYLLYVGTTATGTFPGSGVAMNFGLQTVGGTYTVIGTSVSTGCSVHMTGSALVSVTPTVVPAVTLHTTPGDTVCAGTVVTLNPVPANGGAAPVYQWTVNGVSVATSNTYGFIPANGDVVGVTMTSSAICPLPATAHQSQTMVVDPYSNPIVAIAADPGATVCKGTTITLNAIPTYGGNAPIYQWMKNSMSASSGSSYSYIPENNDVVYVIMQSDYLCRLANADTSAALAITVDTGLTPQVSVSASPSAFVSVGETATLTAAVANAGSGPTYQWLVNSVPQPGATNTTFTYTNSSNAGEDSVACQVTSSGMCPVSSFGWIYINEAPAGVSHIANRGANISVLPNPNSGEFHVTGSLGVTVDEEVTMEVTDLLGQVVYKHVATAKGGRLNETIQLPNAANGMYLLTVSSDAGSEAFHVVVEK